MRRAEIEGMMAIVVKGDALDEASVKAAFDQIEEVDAVVTTVGGTPADARADSEACALAHSRREHAVQLRVYAKQEYATAARPVPSPAHPVACINSSREEGTCTAHKPTCVFAKEQGNINLIKAAVAKGVKRFVLVTSIGTGDSKDAPPKQVYDVLEKVLVQKAKAEEYLMVRS